MRKLMNVFLVVAAVVASQMGYARSIMPSVVSYAHQAKPELMGGLSEQLIVYANGNVLYRPLQAVLPAPQSRVIGYLSADKIDQLNRLVVAAEKGKMGFKRVYAFCIRPASHTEIYRASMGQINLKEGAFCDGGFKINTSPAANTLVNYLNRLRTKFNIPGGGPKQSSRPSEIRLPIELENSLDM